MADWIIFNLNSISWVQSWLWFI